MNAIERLRQARSVDSLAEEIEPLAQSLAILADDTRDALSDALAQAQRQAETWSQQQAQSAVQWQQTARALEQATIQLDQATQRARRLLQWQNWRLWAGVLLASLIASAVAPSVYALWQQTSSAQTQAATNWEDFTKHYQQLSPKDRSELHRMLKWPPPPPTR